MDEVKIIHKEIILGKEIDVWGTFEEPYFRASDVASWLGFKNISTSLKCLDPEELTKFNLGSRQGEVWFLTEDGLYDFLMQSRKPAAKEFKKGVKAILKEIRKTGAYVAIKEDDTEEDIIARGLIAAKAALERKEARVRELEAQTEQQAQTIGIQQKELTVAAPKVKYYDDTLASTDCLTTTQVADDLGISARALNQQLSNAGVQYFQSGSWHLKGKFREWQLASTRTYNYIKGDGSTGTKVNLVWNQRGKRFILALYNNNFNVKNAIAEINGEKRAALESKDNQSNF